MPCSSAAAGSRYRYVLPVLVASDKVRDLALLKIAGDPLPPLKLGDSRPGA